ncbi:hypothetical protein SEA_SONALI_45 [Arthrobacter phage Sonali]|uniref:Uncharacterized protein n=1 Tax=Arthrobacter phage Sonali TaxID=2510495 RepID=A0A411CQS8_9CAUD|nr:hypothetical protein HOV09_gp45 [Arthrobacter phage Sonali]QAY16157.1 hypothetical protein SEA_SONALI_45 [Arthrobacter phage Sonali]
MSRREQAPLVLTPRGEKVMAVLAGFGAVAGGLLALVILPGLFWVIGVLAGLG